ncbi:MAG: hypothetical protein WD795_16975 [Woeseia sp.]
MSTISGVAADNLPIDEDNVLTIYTIECYEGELVGEECVGGYWLTNQPMRYRVLVDQQVVVSWFPELPTVPPDKHTNCAVASVERWTCWYRDGSGEFGFREGEYYDEAGETLEEIERQRRAWGQIYVDEERWLEVQDHGEEAIREHQSDR